MENKEEWCIKFDIGDDIYSAYHLHDDGKWYWAGVLNLPECYRCLLPTPEHIKFQVRLLRGS